MNWVQAERLWYVRVGCGVWSRVRVSVLMCLRNAFTVR